MLISLTSIICQSCMRCDKFVKDAKNNNCSKLLSLFLIIISIISTFSPTPCSFYSNSDKSKLWTYATFQFTQITQVLDSSEKLDQKRARGSTINYWKEGKFFHTDRRTRGPFLWPRFKVIRSLVQATPHCCLFFSSYRWLPWLVTSADSTALPILQVTL